MQCWFCNKEFEIDSKGSGGKNRKFCYECYPSGLSRTEREKLRKSLIYQKIANDKIQKGCDICGYNKCASALEWHHPEDNKENNPSNFAKDGTLTAYEKYIQETQKCQLLCANCHRELHAGLTVISS